MASEPWPEQAFAALALLRCRDRIAPVLDAIAEPRRLDVARAVAELHGFDDYHLKHLLTEVVRREERTLGEARALFLGAASQNAPRTIRKWAARMIGR